MSTRVSKELRAKPKAAARKTVAQTKAVQRPVSIATRMAHALEADILAGKLQPGTRLDEQSLARRFQTSRTPVREALRQLESRGIVQSRPRQGIQVMQLGLAELMEMFETMAWLEAACASLAARRHTQGDRDAIQAAHAACVEAHQQLDPEAFYRANATWHETIYRASQNSYLEQQTLSLRNRLEPYRRATTFHEGLMALSIQEHQRIADAVLSMEQQRAMQEMHGHLDTLRNDAVRSYGALLRPE